MKKASCVLYFLLSSFLLFAGGFSDIKRYDASFVNKLNILLRCEHLYISETDEAQIIIITETDKKEAFPSCQLNDNTLTLTSSFQERPDYCNVNIFLPKGFSTKEVQLRADKIDISTLNTDFLKIDYYDENFITIKNLDCKKCNMVLFFGEIDINFLHAPQEESLIRQKQGKIKVTLPPQENFTVFAKSFNSKLINGLNNEVLDYIREGKTLVNKNGGPVLTIQTHNGDIILN